MSEIESPAVESLSSAARVGGFLRGRVTGITCGVTWVAQELCDEVCGLGAATSPADAVVGFAQWVGADLAFVPATAPWADEAVVALRAAGIASGWAVSGPLTRLADDAGWSRTLAAAARSREQLVAEAVLHLPHVVADVERGVSLGADCVVLADDLAGESGWLFGPEVAGDLVRRAVPSVVRAALGTPVLFHSDGDVASLFPEFAELGVVAIHLASPRACDPEAVLSAATAAGLRVLWGVRPPLGGVEVRSDRAGVLERARAGVIMLCDDGGMTSAADAAFIRTFFMRARTAC